MKNKAIRIKILSGMLCTGLALSGATTSFAAVSGMEGSKEKLATSMDFRATMDKKQEKEIRHAEMKVVLEAVIKDSVKGNIITEAEGNKVLEYVKVKFEVKAKDTKKDKKCRDGKCDKAKGGLFEDLVTEGILTKEKADALREKMYDKKSEMRTEQLEKGLNTLVANKVLTAEQSKKVKEAMMARDAERKENFKKMRSMNEKEKEEYMKKLKSTRVNPMKALVDNGTITKEQEKEIQKVLPYYNHGRHGKK